MNTSAIVGIGIGLLFLFVLAVELETRLLDLSSFLNNNAWDWLFAPAKGLYNITLGKLFSWISGLLSKTWVGRLDKTLANKRLGGLRPLIWAVAALVFVVVWLIRKPEAGQELLMNYVTGTAIGAPIAFFVSGFSLTVPTLIGAGFTRFLTTEAMRQQNEEPEPTKTAVSPYASPVVEKRPEMHIAVQWLYGLILVGAFSLLGTAMGGIFESISATITMLIDRIGSLKLFSGSAGFWDWFYLIVTVVGVIVIGYSWFLLVFMTIKEYISNISYCLMPLFVLSLVTAILALLGLTSVNWLVIVLAFFAMCFGEWHRYQLEHDDCKRAKYLNTMKKFRFFTNVVWPAIKRRLNRFHR